MKSVKNTLIIWVCVHTQAQKHTPKQKERKKFRGKVWTAWKFY